MPTDLMQSRLTTLRMYRDNPSLTPTNRQRALEYQVRTILSALNQEPEQERRAIVDYLRLSGFDDLIAEYR